MSDLTKRAMADALKELLKSRTLDRITIQDVADAAHVSRKTFYYHFHDIFDLLEWMMVEGAKGFPEPADGEGEDFWVRNVSILLNYAVENRRWVMNGYQSIDRERLEAMLRKAVEPQVETALRQAIAGRPVREEDVRFVADFFTYGVSALFLSWVADGMRQDPAYLQDKLTYFLKDSVQLMAERCVAHAESTN